MGVMGLQYRQLSVTTLQFIAALSLLEWVNQKNPDKGAHFDENQGIRYRFLPSLPLLPAQNKARPNTLAVTVGSQP